MLWIPIEGERNDSIGATACRAADFMATECGRGGAVKQDWEELMDLIVLGEVKKIDARIGEVMQLRPERSNNQALTKGDRATGRL